MKTPKFSSIMALADARPAFRSMEAVRTGTPRATLTRLVRQGELTRLGRGVYARANRPSNEFDSLIEVAMRTRQGVFCLLTALQFYNLTTQSPSEIWLALPNKARAPKIDYPPAHIVWYSGASLTEGIESHIVDGQNIRIYSVAKTIADCFKYRNKIGIDVAIEALQDAWRQNKVSMGELYYFGKICRVEKIMRPYMESLF